VTALGCQRLVKGNFPTRERVVFVDDILISAMCIMAEAVRLKSAGLDVHDIVVFIEQ
jgi:uridine monophosphate synthetase